MLKRGFLFIVLSLLLLPAFRPAEGKTLYRTDAELSDEARQAFGEILDLWRDGRYDELFERTRASGKLAREDFARRLENAPRKPACCWQKLQDVSVRVEKDNKVEVRAKVGLEGGGDIEFKTRSFKLVKERDRWRISQADLFSLAAAKARKRHKHR